MFSYSTALMTATYKNGRPGQPTEAHEKAEHHRFKKQFLFKNPQIPQDIYISRLIQHFVILKAIETQLQNLSDTDKAEINAFFSLSYLENLWRTPAIIKDLQELEVNIATFTDDKITPATKKYLQDIEQLTPKNVLAHFLVHVAGFMHGGAIISAKLIEPSNRLTTYKIPTHQYNFLSTSKRSSMAAYADMMEQVDTIGLNNNEYQQVLQQGQNVYETMSAIYDDLCDMHTHQRNLPCRSLAIVSVSMVAMAVVLKLLAAALSPMTSQSMAYGSN